MNNGYRALAPVYDRLNSDVDYGKWADFIEECFRKYCDKTPVSILELGCGTGSMTLELARRGYDMTALDISEEMLSVAHMRAEEEKLRNILFLQSDMTDFELYGTVDAIVCCLDGINHLTRREDVAACFALAANYLNPGGAFLFDLNTPYKFKTLYADNDYILEEKGAVCCWRNRLNAKSDACDFYLTVFEELPDGSYRRSDGVQRERRYGMRAIRNLLREAGLELASVVASYAFDEIADTTERWYFTARKPV